jgi:hypothetical protein
VFASLGRVYAWCMYGELMYLEWRYGMRPQRGRMEIVALGEWEEVEWALVMLGWLCA